jgi:Fe-S cluster biogenesis protein NfuA
MTCKKNITHQLKYKMKSVKTINPFKSVIQISYDFVKAHGGEIKVATKENEGSEFIINLPT